MSSAKHSRRDFLKTAAASATFLALPLSTSTFAARARSARRPNILLAIADDWGWPHAGAYGDPVVNTAAFDRIAREGVLFEHAFVSAPSCTPCRNSLLTGQQFYRLEEGANLWSLLKTKFPVYPLLLERHGYSIGHWRKSWGPGSLKAGGYVKTHPVGQRFNGFADFMNKRPKDKPFCFWLGSSDPHRPYKPGTGKADGMDLSKVPVPGFYPDDPVVRSDIADYYYEVQRFNRDVAAALEVLEDSGELENTIIVMTGDHGMPFPRCKANVYDMGVRVPLAIRWGARCKPGRRVTDFVSFTDLAPTFLEAAGVDIPEQMTGRSIMKILRSDSSGRVDPSRDHVVFGRERHVPVQKKPSLEAYPVRAIREDGWLCIHNLRPDLWPAGIPGDQGTAGSRRGMGDCDDGPTKLFIIENKDDAKVRRSYDLCFAKRPERELYDCTKDPYQLNNLADNPECAQTMNRLSAKLEEYLRRTDDPRTTGKPHPFDTLPYPLRD